MINIDQVKRKCKDDFSKIENYDKAVADKTKTWACHHRLEVTLDGKHNARSKKELERFGMYYKRPYFELIFLTPSEHRKLHSNTDEERKKNSKARKNKGNKGRVWSEFGRKFKEHFGITRTDNIKLYNKEEVWYQRNGKCRWEKK